MKISVMQLGPIETNCYIAADEKTNLCAVIDPGDDGARVAAAVEKMGYTVDKIFLTHAHFDHTGGLRALREKTDAPIYVHPDDVKADSERHISRGNLIWTDLYDDGDEIKVGGLTFRVLHTPGHTPGSVCLLVQGVLFSGDTLFAGCCGRTDLPGGSWDEMMDSLKKIGSLPGDLPVLPGHEERTSLDQERRVNPELREAMGE